MRTSLGDTYIATFVVETDAGELGMSGPHVFEVEVNLRGLAEVYRRAVRSQGLQATELGRTLVVRVVG